MNATEPNPTDILAQERAKTAQSASAAPMQEDCMRLLLREPAGRAFLFSMLASAGTWAKVSTSDPMVAGEGSPEERMGRRNWGAEWLATLMSTNPISVGLMWQEAMLREFEKQKGVAR